METTSRKRIRKCLIQTPQVIKEAPRKRLRKQSFQIPRMNNNEDEFFGQLTDDIIECHILSRLSLEDAARCSTISRRWFKLWIQSIPSKLIFSYPSERLRRKRQLDKSRHVFTRGINYVLRSHQNPTLDELSIRFDFGPSSSSAIENWVEYAFRKGVTRLELDLSPWKQCGYRYSNEFCTFPGIAKVGKFLALSPNNVHHHHLVKSARIPNLRDLCLKAVKISSELIHLILAGCPLLERLCVFGSFIHEVVSINDQAAKLKSLEFDCGTAGINISSSTLISLHYNRGDRDGLCVEHAPLLSELSIGWLYSVHFLREVFDGKHQYVSQLKKLTLDVVVERGLAFTSCLLEFPTLKRLEELTLKVRSHAEFCLLWPILLIKAAPSLQKISLQFMTWLVPREMSHQDYAYEKDIEDAIGSVRFHKCLKVVEMHDFYGYNCVLELGRRLLGISLSLQRFVVWQERSHTIDGWSVSKCPGGGCAKQLSRWIPRSAKLEII